LKRKSSFEHKNIKSIKEVFNNNKYYINYNQSFTRLKLVHFGSQQEPKATEIIGLKSSGRLDISYLRHSRVFKGELKRVLERVISQNVQSKIVSPIPLCLSHPECWSNLMFVPSHRRMLVPTPDIFVTIERPQRVQNV